MLTVNALTAADEYLVITDPSRFALDGIRGVRDTADVVRTYFNAGLTPAGVIVNLVDSTLETRQRLDELRTMLRNPTARAGCSAARRRQGGTRPRPARLWDVRHRPRRCGRLRRDRTAHRAAVGARCDLTSAHPPHPAAPIARANEADVLAPFSTRLPPALIERLRVAAPQLGMRQGEIAARAIDRFLRDHGH